jgi:transcriptional regulator with XRE-family HTH domain
MSAAFGGKVGHHGLSEAARETAQLEDTVHRAFLERLGLLMDLRGLSGRELARQTHIPVKTVLATINGETRPSAGKLIAIAAVLGVSVDALFDIEVPERFLREFRASRGGSPAIPFLDG